MKSKPRNSCWGTAIALLARRASSRREVEQYLRRREYEPDEVADALRRLTEYRYLDDEEFGRSLVRKYGGRYGWHYVVAKLRQRGVDDPDILQRLRGELADDDEADGARQLLEKHRKRCFVDGAYDWQKAARLLQNRGYSMTVIRRTLHSISDADLD